MTEATNELLAELRAQELELQLDSFTNEDALLLGTALVETARQEGLSVTIDIRRGDQQLFHCALAGTSADNDAWIERKNRVVRRFGHSSYLMRVDSELRGASCEEEFLLDPREFAAHGGAFPIIVRDVGPIGTVTVSGLPQAEDHRLVVETLRAFLAG